MDQAVESTRNGIISSGNTMVANIVIIAVIVIIALVVQMALVNLIRLRYRDSGFGSISLIEHLARAAVWLLAFIIVCKPVLGIEPTALVAAFGVGSLIISLGLQDTISNVFSGLQLAAHKVIRPGDHVEIDGTRGEIVDTTWRHTTIVDKNGDTQVFPNSYLNSVPLKQFTKENGYRHMFDIEVRPTSDLDAVAADIVESAKRALEERGYLQEGLDPVVMFGGSTAYGVQASVRIYVNSELVVVPAIDAVMRALKQRPYLSNATRRNTEE